MGLRLTFILIFINGVSSFGQTDSLVSNYIRTFPEKITTRISLINTSNSFQIRDKSSNSFFDLKPNERQYLGASILFRSVEIDYGFTPSFIKENKDNEDSKLFNLNFRMFLGQWMQTLDFYKEKGFTASNGQNTIELPEFKTLTFGGSTSYIFNPNFSFRAIGFQNEWQKKSAGSFVPRLFYYYTIFDPSIPQTSEGFSNTHSIDLAIAPSYYYNFVLNENFLFGVGAGLGIGINVNDFDDKIVTTALYEYLGRAVLGYNSERFFAGVNSSLTIFDHNADRETRIKDNISFVEFYIGYRFNAPKSFIKLADKVNKTLGL
ncbi:DUF4421 family protein [Winogradskyella sp. A3E31]|uniref:DUF4421 family protein n=1 Tax=Winogradskyella sp. A3E31 TaxID=3349637 RepID=UPI00398A6534